MKTEQHEDDPDVPPMPREIWEAEDARKPHEPHTLLYCMVTWLLVSKGGRIKTKWDRTYFIHTSDNWHD